MEKGICIQSKAILDFWQALLVQVYSGMTEVC